MKMNKKLVVNSLKGIVCAGAMAFGLSLFGGQTSAAELTKLDKAAEVKAIVEQAKPAALLSSVTTTAAPAVETVKAVAKTAAPAVEKAAVAAPTAPAANATGNTSVIPEKPPVQTGDPQAKDPSIISEEKSSLINIGLSGSLLKPITGDVNIDVLGSKKVETDKGTLSTAGVVQADLTGSAILGDTHAGVIETKNVKTANYEYSYSALADVDVNKSIIGDAHAGVAEKETVKTDKYTWEHSGLVIVDTKGTPVLGDLHAGVLENEKYEAKPGNDTTKPGDDTTKPGDDTTKPGDDTTKPGDDTTKPGDDATKPSEQTQTPAGNNANNGNNVLTVKPVSSDNFQNEKVASGNVLPNTGHAVDPFLLVLFSLMLIATGFTLRKLNIKRVS